MGERNKRILMDQLQMPKNKFCADCNAPGMLYVSDITYACGNLSYVSLL